MCAVCSVCGRRSATVIVGVGAAASRSAAGKLGAFTQPELECIWWLATPYSIYLHTVVGSVAIRKTREFWSAV